MGFAKFNVCSPCCNYEFICHPYVVVDVVDPRDGISATPTPNDLYANLLSVGGSFPCRISTAMYPSGGNYEIPNLYPSSISPCEIPYESFFGINHTTGKFIEDYENGSLVDLNTLLKKITSNSKQRFDVPRSTGANALQCGSSVGSGPITTGCPCYEVSGNNSSAWGMVNYQVYPHQFFDGCSSGQYSYINDKYANCSQVFDICSADLCNGSGIENHKTIKLPYCLTEITAEFPYYLENASISNNKGVPQILAIYDSNYDICDTGNPYYYHITSILSTCHSTTGNLYQWYYKPNIYRSGCGHLYLNAAYTTSAYMYWSPILINNIEPENGLCNPQTRYIMFGCQSLNINMCGVTNFTPEIISDKTGYPIANYSCVVDDDCPECVYNPYTSQTFAKKPISAQVSYTLPNAAGYEYSGDLYLDNVPWEGYAGVGPGCGVWVPNPYTQPCTTSGYDLSFAAFVSATVTSISCQGYQASTYCVHGFGCYLLPTCYQNEWNYALVYGYSIDMGFGCSPQSHPVVRLTNPYRYYPTDIQNTYAECCDKTTGNPNGTLEAIAGDCDPLPSPDYAYRAASPGSMWNSKTCCELYVSWLHPFPSPLTFSEYCNFYGHPECTYDSMPSVKQLESYVLTNDICNDIIDCSVYDADGNLIYTVTI